MFKTKDEFLAELMETFPKPVDEHFPQMVSWVNNRLQIIGFHTALVKDEIAGTSKPLTKDEIRAMMGVIEQSAREMFNIVQAMSEYSQILKKRSE